MENAILGPVQEIRPGLYRWTARHPDWTPDEGGPEGWEPVVASYAYAARDELVLFDPLITEDAIWTELDRLTAEHGPPTVLITIYWHVRSANEVVGRYAGSSVWIHERLEERGRERIPSIRTFGDGEVLAGGIEPKMVRRGEVVYWIPDLRAIVAGDVLLGSPAGGVRLLPDSWLGDLKREELLASLQSVVDLPVELVLLTHGDAVENGQAALRAAVTA